MLVEHRVDDVDERFVGVEQAVTPGEEIAFEPALALMLAQHLHDATLGREPFIVGDLFGHPLTGRRFEHRVEPV